MQHLNKLLRPALLLATLLAGCATAPAPEPPRAPVTVRLIAFNDLHGNLEVSNLTLPWPNPADPARPARVNVGGAAPMAGLVKALRDGAAHSVLLSSGDAIGGTPLISALFRHESTIDVLNRIGTDLGTVGNHEFDAGAAELQRVLAGGCRAKAPGDVTSSCALGPHTGAAYPTVAANVWRSDGTLLFPASVVLERGGVKIGFIGAVLRGTPSIVVPSGVAGLRFGDEAQALNAEAARLQAQGVQALVAVIHEGGSVGDPAATMEWNDAACKQPRGTIFDIERKLTSAIDVVFSAHTHQGYRCVFDGRPVMQAVALGRGLSVVDLVVNPASGEVDRARTQHRNLPIFNEHTDAALRERIIAAEPAPYAQAMRQARPDPEVAARVARYSEAARPLAERPVGHIGGSFVTAANGGNNSAGRLIADAQWAATRSPDRGGAQFALMNQGGVRAGLPCRGTPPCTVTYGDVFTMQPFGNSLVVMTLSGAQIKQLLEGSARADRPAAPPGLISSSSLSYSFHASQPHGQRVRELRIGGQPVDPAADYRFTVNSFMADGGDGHTLLNQGRDRLGGELDIDALTAYLQAHTPSPDPMSRVTLVP